MAGSAETGSSSRRSAPDVKGRSYVLLLSRFSDGKFGVVGGPQGRCEVRDGKVAGSGEHARAQGVGKHLHGLKLSDFERNYRALAGSRAGEPGRQKGQEPLGPSNAPPKQ